jgi:DNA-binding MarR family transcriptional regulator
MSDRQPIPTDADEVARLFADAMHAMMRRSAATEIAVLNDVGLTIPQMVALHVLRERGPVTVGDVAGCTKLSPAATSHLVERLVQMGLVHRTEDAEDRRQKQVSVSPTGAALVERLMQNRLESLMKAMSIIQPETRRKVAIAMAALVSDFAAQDAKEKTP